MQLKRFFVLVALTLFLSPIYAQTAATHQVFKGETLYKIAVKYNVTIDALKAANPKIATAGIKQGDIVKIPGKSKSAGAGVAVRMDSNPTLPNEKADLSKVKTAPSTAKNTEKPANNAVVVVKDPNAGKSIQQAVKDIVSDKPKTASVAETKTTVKTLSDTTATKATAPAKATTQPKPIKHKVGQGETLYSIAKMYNQNITALQAWNKLPDFAVKPGQDIIVEWVIPSGEALVKVANKTSATPAAPASKSLSAFERKYSSVEKDPNGMYRKITQTGITTCFDDSGASATSGGNMYALHRTAPLRTILRVSNPMNGKAIYVMVIERLPSILNNENVMMSLTKSAAKKLNILDEKSIVECKYYILK